MTFAKLSAAGEDASGTLGKTLKDEGGIDPAGTHYPNRANIRGVLIPGDPCAVGCRVAAPVTEKP